MKVLICKFRLPKRFTCFKKLKGHINWIFKLLHFEKFVAELIIFACNQRTCVWLSEFISKTMMYVSWLENEDAKVRIFQDLKFGLNDFCKFMTDFKITVSE